jgi:hypothetical protein
MSGGDSSGSPSTGSLAATGGATGSSTTGTATTGSGQSGSVTSGTAQTGASSGTSSGSVSAGTGSGTGGSGASTGATSGSGNSGEGSGRPCTLLSTTPTGGINGNCVLDYTLAPQQTCGAADAGVGLPTSLCATVCPMSGSFVAMWCDVVPDESVPPTQSASLECGYTPCGTGRRPEGLVPIAKVQGPSPTARLLAATAYLEAASVHAFEHLAFELEAHGAPTRLSRAARRAARDEVRHARVVAALAENEGGVVPEVREEWREVRSLEDMALENTIEGCVRETFGAAIAMIQAARARDAHVRRAMKSIARDETRHAELSWAVARWLMPKLDVASRHRVHEAQEKAIAALVHDAAQEPDQSLTEKLGVPSAPQALAVLADLKAALWSDSVPA